MADKLYTKNTWTDEQLASAALYDISESDDTPINENVKIELATEVVTAGTLANATRMNNLENGINNIDDLLVSLQSKLKLDAATEITVSSGTLTLTQSVHKVQPESGTADDIDNLAGLSAGQFGVLFPSDNGTDTLTLKHGTGNISCIGGSDIALSEGAVIIYYDGTTYFVIGTSAGGGGSVEPSTCNGRLTLESGVPVSTSDQSAKTTVYFTPFRGNAISLYNTTSSAWERHTFTELSLSLSGYTANKNYDIWIYDNAGTPTLASTAWTDNSTRATALTTQDGINVKTGALNYRYIGTIRINSTGGQCDDSRNHRYVYNSYNQVNRLVFKELYDPHDYAETAAQFWNNTNTNFVDFVLGESATILVSLSSNCKINNTSYKLYLAATPNTISTSTGSRRIESQSTEYFKHVVTYYETLYAGYNYIGVNESVSNSSGIASFTIYALQVALFM